MMMEEQESQQHTTMQPQHSRIVEPRQRVIVPTRTTMMTEVNDTTFTCRDQDYYDEDENIDTVDIGINNEITTIKQVLYTSVIYKWVLSIYFYGELIQTLPRDKV